MRQHVLLGLWVLLVTGMFAQAEGVECKAFGEDTCEEQEGCTFCKMNLPVIKVQFCIEDDTAAKLPESEFEN